jgi:hypothetical protein
VARDDGLERRPDLKAGDSYSASPVDDYNPADTLAGGSAELWEFHERAGDDTALNAQPRRNVDYPSYD